MKSLIEDESSKGETISGKLIIGIILSLLLLCTPRLNLDLNVDELSSYWVVRDSITDVFQRSIYIQGQTPLYYTVLWFFTKAFGTSPLALRILSVLCLVCSCILIKRLGTKIFNGEIGIYSIFGFLSIFEIVRSGSEARPYALTISLALAATIALVKWCESITTERMIGYLSLLLATIYGHYLFALVIPIHAVWVLISYFRCEKEEGRRLLKQTFQVITLTIIGLVPCIYQLYLLSSKGKQITFTKPPSADALLSALNPSEIGIALAIILLLQVFCWRRNNDLPLRKLIKPFNRPLILAVAFLLLPPAVLYIAVKIAGLSIFIARYYSERAIGAGLIIGFLIISLVPRNRRAIVAVGIIGISSLINFKSLIEPGTWNGWGPAAERINLIDPDHQCPILIQPGYIESQTISFLYDRQVLDYLTTPLSYYGISNPSVVIPYSFSTDEARHYFTSTVEPNINRNTCFWLLYRNVELLISDRHLLPAPQYLKKEFPKRGLQPMQSFEFGQVELILYR